MISPVVPFRLSQSPSCSTTPPSSMVLASASTRRASHPQMHVLPQPRATTAAWDVIPPRAVSTPVAAFMPPTSSGDVSMVTRITFSPAACRASASAAVKTTWPTAAPGEAGRPLPMTSGL